jgi:AraC-like DNA-binding protein
MRSFASPLSGSRLLDSFPLIRSRSAEEARQCVGRVFSPHRLELRGDTRGLDMWHNRVALGQSSLNVLHYGAEVLIDPGERGDFYLVQLPLAGSARVSCNGDDVEASDAVLSVLQPCVRSNMQWSNDCTMLLLQAPSRLVHDYVGADEPRPRMALSRCRHEPEVAAWWQAMLDLTRNIDQFGAQWRAHPSAIAAIEGFLLAAFSWLLYEPSAQTTSAPTEARSLRRAKDYINAHLDRPLVLAEIARHACVSPRTLELVFKRHGEPSPLAYARRQRLQAAHAALRQAAREGHTLSVTNVAMAHGFVHMGRFSAQYQARFGCLPSETLKQA